MARYKLTLAYDGTGFSGSQKQAKQKTVQAELERALRQLGWKDSSILLSGRTDTGVHAEGQVAAFDLEWSHLEEDLLKAANALLPQSISVRDVQQVEADFHPRFDAVSRTYRYRLFCQPLRDPIREYFSWRVWPQVKLEVLQIAASQLIGTHDFSAFGSPTTPKGRTTRSVMRAEWKQTDADELTFEVQADAFLYRMVRRMVFVQVAAGQGKLSVEKIGECLEKQLSAGKRSVLPSGIAPAHGLTLVAVEYR